MERSNTIIVAEHEEENPSSMESFGAPKFDVFMMEDHYDNDGGELLRRMPVKTWGPFLKLGTAKTFSRMVQQDMGRPSGRIYGVLEQLEVIDHKSELPEVWQAMTPKMFDLIMNFAQEHFEEDE